MKGRTFKLLVTALVAAISLTVMAGATSVSVGTVTASSVLNFRSAPSTSSSIKTTLPKGTTVAIVGSEGDFYKAVRNGTIGFLSKNYIAVSATSDLSVGSGKITGSSVNFRKEPNTSCAVIGSFVAGDIVNVVGVKDGWYKVSAKGSTGYVHPDYVEIIGAIVTTAPAAAATATSAASADTTSASSDTRSEIISYAKTLLGVKYKYGGTSPSTGFDCSGYTSYVFSKFGISLSHSSKTQSTQVTKISKSDLLPGDLVFFSNSSSGGKVGHVGIYIGDGKFIHSSSPGSDVRIDSMSSTYYSNHYLSSGRVL